MIMITTALVQNGMQPERTRAHNQNSNRAAIELENGQDPIYFPMALWYSLSILSFWECSQLTKLDCTPVTVCIPIYGKRGFTIFTLWEFTHFATHTQKEITNLCHNLLSFWKNRYFCSYSLLWIKLKMYRFFIPNQPKFIALKTKESQPIQ